MTLPVTILSVAEATHYLVGVTDDDNRLIALPTLKTVTVCDSLAQAKQLLRELHFESADLIMQTAYDEMCGLGKSEEVKVTINL